MVVAMSSPVDIACACGGNACTVTALSAQAWKTMPKQNSLAKAEERTRCMPAYCVEAAAQHVITDPHPFKGSAAVVAR